MRRCHIRAELAAGKVSFCRLPRVVDEHGNITTPFGRGRLGHHGVALGCCAEGDECRLYV